MAFLILFPDLTVRANLYRPSGAAFFWCSVRRSPKPFLAFIQRSAFRNNPHTKHVIPSRSVGPASSAVNFPVRTTAQDKKRSSEEGEAQGDGGARGWNEEKSLGGGRGSARRRLGKKIGSKRDPSSRKALLWMTAKGGLDGRTGRLGEEGRLV